MTPLDTMLRAMRAASALADERVNDKTQYEHFIRAAAWLRLRLLRSSTACAN
jgi:hypothetical protein